MRRSDDGVSDVLGSMFMVSITITMTIGFSLFVAALPGPPDESFTEVSMKAFPGQGGWGTGDEMLVVKHLYGESLPQDQVKILFAINNVTTVVEGSALAFSDGHLDIGESWAYPTLLKHEDAIAISIVVPHGGGQRLMASSAIVTGSAACDGDNDPPHAIFNQIPGDVGALTAANPVLVEALIVDVCSGIGPAVPQFTYEYGGAPTQMPMTNVGPDRWQFSIPAPAGTWASAVGQTLEYQVLGMQDGLGNTADSPLQSDYIDPIPPAYYYVDSATPTIGSILDFPRMQAAETPYQAATLTDGSAGAATTVARYYPSVAWPATGWEKHGDAAAPDELDDKPAKYRLDSPDPLPLWLGMNNPPASLDAIKKVVIVAEGYQEDWVDDGWRLQACIIVGCTPISGVRPAYHADLGIPSPDTAAEFSFDITTLRPGGGTWSQMDLMNLEVKIYPKIVFTEGLPAGDGSLRDGDWLVDSTWMEVTTGDGYDMEVDLEWTSIPAAGSHGLEIRYYVLQGEYEVQVWNGADWIARPTILDAAGMTTWSTTLDLNEWNLGEPKVRIKSLMLDPNTAGNIIVDYARVTV